MWSKSNNLSKCKPRKWMKFHLTSKEGCNLSRLKSYGNQGSLKVSMGHKDCCYSENDLMSNCITSMLSMKSMSGSEEESRARIIQMLH